MIKTRIISTGASVPEQVITNDDLSKIVDTSDEWITQRTGIKKRHISGGENTSHFAINTARQVLERAEVAAEDVDLIIVASVTADYGTPSLACMVQKEIGAINAVAFDVNAACSGFMFALSIADKNAAHNNFIVCSTIFILSGFYVSSSARRRSSPSRSCLLSTGELTARRTAAGGSQPTAKRWEP